jgi:hypothetical protein
VQTLTSKPLKPAVVPVQGHDWFAYVASRFDFPSRKQPRICRRCGVACLPDTEFASCNVAAPKKVVHVSA